MTSMTKKLAAISLLATAFAAAGNAVAAEDQYATLSPKQLQGCTKDKHSAFVLLAPIVPAGMENNTSVQKDYERLHQKLDWTFATAMAQLSSRDFDYKQKFDGPFPPGYMILNDKLAAASQQFFTTHPNSKLILGSWGEHFGISDRPATEEVFSFCKTFHPPARPQ